MKQFTNESQTAKLIELGFEKPKSIGGYKPKFSVEYEGEQVPRVDVSEDTDSPIYAYSIGELIDMLPPRTHSGGFVWDLDINHDYKFERWLCSFNPENQIGVATELVDALFNLLIKLKEEGVI